MGPGFSERTFEFCYNAEYCQINAALLASHPHIPSQQAEKDLGYDVEFEIDQGGFTRSLFLQHKVASFAERKAGKNAHFFDTHGQPYFRFPIDNEQHNTLCQLSQTKGNAFYCAPRFHLSHQLGDRFRSSTITNSVIWLNPVEVGAINDTARHNITYDALGQNPTLHSEPKRFSHSFTGENMPKLKQQKISPEYVEDLSNELLARSQTSKLRPSLDDDLENASSVERAQIILGRVYQVTWLLLP